MSSDHLQSSVTGILRLLAIAQQHYLGVGDLGRRDVNQAVFDWIYIEDDEVVGSDLTEAFWRVLSDTLD